MNRRTLLSSLGSGAAGLAGCASVLGGEGTPTLSPVDVQPTATPSLISPPELGADCAEADGETAPRPDSLSAPPAHAAGLGCPTIGWAARTVCHHTADLATEDVVLFTDDDRAFIGNYLGDGVSFVLVNGSSEPVRTVPGGWTVLHRPRGDRWQAVASGDPTCSRTLAPDAYHWWRLGINTSRSTPETNVTGASLSLEAGRYLLAVAVVPPDSRPIVCAAPFAIRQYDPQANAIQGSDSETATRTANATAEGTADGR